MIVESHEDVIELSGELQVNAWETIRAALALLLESHPSGVIVDCNELTRCTVEGAQTFVHMLDFVHGVEGARMIVAAAPPCVEEVIHELPELEAQLSVVDTVEEARKSIDLLRAEADGTVDPEGPRDEEQEAHASIVAVMTGSESDTNVLEMVQMLYSAKVRGPIAVVLAVKVPKDVPIDAPVPEIENKMIRLQSEAKGVFKQRRIPHFFTIRRGRETYDKISDFCHTVGARHVVVGIPGTSGQTAMGRQSMIELLNSLQTSVILVRGPQEDHVSQR